MQVHVFAQCMWFSTQLGAPCAESRGVHWSCALQVAENTMRSVPVWCAACSNTDADGWHFVDVFETPTASQKATLRPHLVHIVPEACYKTELTLAHVGSCIWVAPDSAPQGGWYLTQQLARLQAPDVVRQAWGSPEEATTGCVSQICHTAYRRLTTLSQHTREEKESQEPTQTSLHTCRVRRCSILTPASVPSTRAIHLTRTHSAYILPP